MQSFLSKPASSLKDCIVGPSEEERTKGGPCWEESVLSGKRKRPAEEDAPSSTLETAVQTFLSSGCCIIPKVLPPAFIKTCLQKATADLGKLNQELEARRAEARTCPSLIANAYRVDYREMVDRDGGRRDVRFDLGNYPYTAPGLIYNSMVLPLIQKLLGEKQTTAVNLLYMGVMWARPSSENVNTPQKWHADGGHLFDHVHLPPHCINVFLPLIDVSSQHGPTQVQPGSHIFGNFNDQTIPTLGLEAQAGDAILFDYRLKHRGALNTSDQPRPILYLAYAKPWFRDAGNTRSGQSIFKVTLGSPWVSRLLTGRALPMGTGFDPIVTNNASTEEEPHPPTSSAEQQQSAGSGERWILFKMNVQLDNDSDGNPREETIVVHNGDIAVEVATQFCLQHKLSDDFINALTDAVQQQMNQVRN